MTRIRLIALRSFLAAATVIPASAAAMTPGTAQAGESAMESFKSRHEAVVKLVKKKASAKALEKEVDKLLDYQWIAEAALGGPSSYAGQCAERCDEFEKLLGELIRQNYLRLLRKADGQEVQYLGEKTGKTGAVKIDTKLAVEKNGRTQDVVVAYVLHRQGGHWQVRDIITDGVSLAKTYRYEFKQIHAKDGIDGIIAKLEQKLKELDKKG